MKGGVGEVYFKVNGAYLIIEDDHDKHSKQHRLHQEDYVMSTG